MTRLSRIRDAALSAQAWTDIPTLPLVLVPTGSTEQHGPHLPLETDSVIATAVATAAAAELSGERPDAGILVAPTITYGASGEHQGFPGTVSIGRESLRVLLVELVRSMSRWAGRIVFVNAHGGNSAAISAAVSQLIGEGHGVAWVHCGVPGGDAHAGRTETSLMLHLAPDQVELARAVPGNTTPIGELLPLLAADGVRPHSASGVLGDPTGANAAEGEDLLAAMVSTVSRSISARLVDEGGHLVDPLASAVPL